MIIRRVSFLIFALLFAAPLAVAGAKDASRLAPDLSRYEGRWYQSNTGRAAANGQSQNNLKNLSIAAHHYHDEHQHLPPGGTFALFDQNIPITAAGAVAVTSVFNPSLPDGSEGAWSTSSGTFAPIILPGDPLVGHPAGGTFDSFGTNFNPVVLSDNGTVAYNAWTSTFPNAGKWGVWAGSTRGTTAKPSRKIHIA